jgi:hypothetical protein
VTVITPGAGSSITSTTTVSTPGPGGFIRCSFFRTAFFVAARLGLAPATVGFVAFTPTGRMLGNFPQAYSHVGLMSARSI